MLRTKEAQRVLHLPVGAIRPNPKQPRRVFDPAGLEELAASIAAYGILQPLSVRPTENGWELVAGERRLRAARLAGLQEVPCLSVAVDEEASGMLALVENLQRRDLDFLEQARGIARLMAEFHLSQDQAAKRLGKSQSAVANKLRILKLPPQVLETLLQQGLTERHARALLRLEDGQRQLRAAELAGANGWTVARLEQYVDQTLESEKKPARRREFGGFRLRDARLLLNSVRHHVQVATAAGIGVETSETENDREVVFTIRIAKK